MKIEKDHAPDGNLILKEVYSGTVLETSEGNRMSICMRDDTFEFNIMPKYSTKSKWYRVNMQTLTVEPLGDTVNNVNIDSKIYISNFNVKSSICSEILMNFTNLFYVDSIPDIVFADELSNKIEWKFRKSDVYKIKPAVVEWMKVINNSEEPVEFPELSLLMVCVDCDNDSNVKIVELAKVFPTFIDPLSNILHTCCQIHETTDRSLPLRFQRYHKRYNGKLPDNLEELYRSTSHKFKHGDNNA